MGDHLRVGRGSEDVALAFQPAFNRLKIFDDAVVDHGQRIESADVRMRVGVGRVSVCCPAGVPDADRAGNGLSGPAGFQAD